MGALGVQSSIEHEEEKKKDKTNEKKEGWAAVRQASQESKNEPLTQEEAALLIQSCKGSKLVLVENGCLFYEHAVVWCSCLVDWKAFLLADCVNELNTVAPFADL